jgi:sulfoxide reductase catalytic subunit YedY
MLIKRAADFRDSDITPKKVYLDRRKFLAGLPAAFVGARQFLSPSAAAAASLANVRKSPLSTTEKVNTFQQVANYNNYYEFGTDKEGVAGNVKNYKMPSEWIVSVEGEVAKPKKYSIDEIMKLAPLEERIYRHRCVEGWSIVVPWVGYSLSELLKQVQPTPKAKFVAFQSYWDAGKQPLARRELAGIDLPYVEGLRLDEAMHPLTMLTVGMFGETLPMQDGAPVRLTVPWKYGFKSIKSLVKIKLVGSMPPTTWNMANSREYGFYSNVNPQVDHPRWSQASEHRLGELRRRQTLMFNGYGDQVASLYSGMDLKKFY